MLTSKTIRHCNSSIAQMYVNWVISCRRFITPRFRKYFPPRNEFQTIILEIYDVTWHIRIQIHVRVNNEDRIIFTKSRG